MAKHGKKYREGAARIEIDKLYEPLPALTLARETSYTKFDGTIEVHIRLGVDPRTVCGRIKYGVSPTPG